MEVEDIKSMKGKEKISMITCYDFSFAKAIDGLIDVMLVGDSMANVVYGDENTREVVLYEMTRHVGAVAKGVSKSLVVADMPFGSDKEDKVVDNAKRLINAGAHAVKVEGKPLVVEKLVSAGIPVMGHVGLLPQTGELRKYGKEDKEAKSILDMAKNISDAGAFSLVVESVTDPLASLITSQVKIPTIGIGAGSGCDGQVLVLYDMLGLFDGPSFAKKYVSLSNMVKDAVSRYSSEVKGGKFP